MRKILQNGVGTDGAFQIPICGYKEMVEQFREQSDGPDKNPYWPCANVS